MVKTKAIYVLLYNIIQSINIQYYYINIIDNTTINLHYIIQLLNRQGEESSMKEKR